MSRTRVQPIVLPQPLEERVDRAAERQLDGTGPASREAVRQEQTDQPGYYHFDGQNWEYLGPQLPRRSVGERR